MNNSDIALQNSNGSPNLSDPQTEVPDPKTEVPHLGAGWT